MQRAPICLLQQLLLSLHCLHTNTASRMALTPTPTGAEMWCRKTKTEQTTAAARINRCHVRSEKKLSKRKDLPKSVGLVERLCYLTSFICISTVAPWRFENPSMWLMFSTLMTLLLCLTFGSCLMACQPSDLSIPLKSVLCYSFAARCTDAALDGLFMHSVLVGRKPVIAESSREPTQDGFPLPVQRF